MVRLFRVVGTAVTIAVMYSCMNFKAYEAPEGLSVSVKELNFPSNTESRSLTVSSGVKWDVTSLPQWVSLQSVNGSASSPYEWTASFSASQNDEFNREGTLVFKAGSTTKEVDVTQNGKKGRYVAVESVSLLPQTLSMTEGEMTHLSLNVVPSDASIKDVTWESSSPSVAAVSQSGLVDALSEGTALITVTTKDGNRTASCTVTVRARTVSVTGVTLDRSSLSMIEGDTQTLTATVMPSDATDKSVSWSTSNPTVAAVSQTGLVTAKSPGSATITVTTVDGGKTASCSVIVQSQTVNVTGVSLDRTDLTMRIEDKQTLTATVLPASATDKSVTWSSTDAGVASVSPEGVVTAKAYGTAQIIVTTVDGSKQADCHVSVVKPIEEISAYLSSSSHSMTVGDTKTINVIIDEQAPYDNFSSSWSNDNNSVIRFLEQTSGSVTLSALSPGTATISYTMTDSFGTRILSCIVSVFEKKIPVTGVSLDRSSLSLTEGDTQLLTATVSPSDASDKSVTWSSNNTSIAMVSPSGLVTAISPGSAMITVKTEDGGKTATCSVTVQAQKVSVTGVSLDKTSLSLAVGDTQTLTATVTPSNATDQTVTWSSSNTSVATVSSTGVVYAKAAGSATITVKTNDGAKTATCAVTVQTDVEGGGNEHTGEEELF